jgi:hypothetical protein
MTSSLSSLSLAFLSALPRSCVALVQCRPHCSRSVHVPEETPFSGLLLSTFPPPLRVSCVDSCPCIVPSIHPSFPLALPFTGRPSSSLRSIFLRVSRRVLPLCHPITFGLTCARSSSAAIAFRYCIYSPTPRVAFSLLFLSLCSCSLCPHRTIARSIPRADTSCLQLQLARCPQPQHLELQRGAYSSSRVPNEFEAARMFEFEARINIRRARERTTWWGAGPCQLQLHARGGTGARG